MDRKVHLPIPGLRRSAGRRLLTGRRTGRLLRFSLGRFLPGGCRPRTARLLGSLCADRLFFFFNIIKYVQVDPKLIVSGRSGRRRCRCRFGFCRFPYRQFCRRRRLSAGRSGRSADPQFGKDLVNFFVGTGSPLLRCHNEQAFLSFINISGIPPLSAHFAAGWSEAS